MMINPLHFLIKNQRIKKYEHPINKNRGFTLIELLVAMILAVLVITPLLGFMINILDTDRKEQAKVNSEQEIQTALDYIAQDLQQAIYIYDAKGINAIKDNLPYENNTDRVPVLVFWKRTFEEEAIDVRVGNTLEGRNDSFVYSLVIYYLIQSNTNNNQDKTWSDQFRIARFELKDGVRDLDNPFTANGDANYISGKQPDQGFALFELSNPTITGSLEDKMNEWKEGQSNTNTTYNLSNTTILVDYIDATPTDDNEYEQLNPVDCTTVFDLENTEINQRASKQAALKVPSFSGTHSYSSNTTLKKLDNSSFYACVDVEKVSAKIFIRGNAYARINEKDANYEDSRQSYFPTTSIQVKGRGSIGID